MRHGPGQPPIRRAPATRWATAALVVALTMIPAGCRGAARPAPTTADLLDRLQTVERVAVDRTYRRVEFGRSWADLDGDGCNTRDEVLAATMDTSRPHRTQRQGRCSADVVAGTWIDLYTGTAMVWTDLKDTRQAERIPIDHIVSLAEAWRYGARDWSLARRVEFANDPLELTPTTSAINQAKSDRDPSNWSPPPVGRCSYASRYVLVKSRYDLPVDSAEKAALVTLLQSCPTG